MDKHLQNDKQGKELRAERNFDLSHAKFSIAAKANGVSALGKNVSSKEKLDRQALERAENEGM